MKSHFIFISSFSFNLYKVTGQFPWSSLRETDRGISTELNVDISSNEIVSFKFLFKELAGYTGGDVSFLKEDFELQVNKQLLWDSVFSASFWGGMLVPIGDKPSSIADRQVIKLPLLCVFS
ncbi:hypothetical protein JD844_027460 [Phrynosoma platyrhinos]|uniref:Uncharacterized protein n=1 Tax=Phrynosoma platyrhinos TaxID=52577 RepID=A0ABQ7SGG8_PHRPL|nr:hypothetical protein JD844_027460 [Phrynosoma platyrhinos]